MMLSLVASLLLGQAASQTPVGPGGPVLPPPTPLTTAPDEVRDWAGFKFLPAGGRTLPAALPAVGDWSAVKGDALPNAAVWRTKVVILDRIDRVHEKGGSLVWPGLHSLLPVDVARVRRAIPQFQALVANLTGGSVKVVVDVVEDPEVLTIQGGDLAPFVAKYLAPRINGGKYEAEDAVFRGPYQSVFVVHPVGGESAAPMMVQGAAVGAVGVPDVPGQEVDGGLARAMATIWQGQVAQRAHDAGLKAFLQEAPDPLALAAKVGWPAILAGADDVPEARFAALAADLSETPRPVGLTAWAPRGKDTTVAITKDSERGSVLTMQEVGNFRAGGFAFPSVEGRPLDVGATPTLAFWAKSDSKDPVVLQFNTPPGGTPAKVVRLGKDVPFAYDNAWHRVKIDLRPLSQVSRILVAPAAADKATARITLGPINAAFSDFEATTEAPDAAPAPEAPSSSAATPEARAAWAATAPPGDERRTLMKDLSRSVVANALAAALAQPDPLDEPLLIQASLYNFEPTIFTPALRALGKLDSPTAKEAMARALRSAASDRARGVAAEILAESGDPKVVSQVLGLNQARSRAARLSAIRALSLIPGDESARMRMAFLPQDDPEIKMAATLTADPNDDYQGRKLLWSAVNEPSDAVRLESLRRLATSTVAEFRTEGLKGVRDDSLGVRVGLLQAWTAAPRPEYGPSIRLALTDRAPRVRAAALEALATSGESVEVKDLPVEDPDPRVQIALLHLAKAKGLALPAEARERMRKSPDPAVRAAVGIE